MATSSYILVLLVLSAVSSSVAGNCYGGCAYQDTTVIKQEVKVSCCGSAYPYATPCPCTTAYPYATAYPCTASCACGTYSSPGFPCPQQFYANTATTAIGYPYL